MDPTLVHRIWTLAIIPVAWLVFMFVYRRKQAPADILGTVKWFARRAWLPLAVLAVLVLLSVAIPRHEPQKPTEVPTYHQFGPCGTPEQPCPPDSLCTSCHEGK